MSWFRNALIAAAAVAIGAGFLTAKEDEESAKAAKPKEADVKKDKKPVEEEAGQKSKMSVPLPVGHDAKKLTIPYRDDSGKLQMRFVMELGKRVDVDHLAMSKLHIQTFDDTEAEEMSITMPDSTLDLNTRVLTAKNGVTIKRDDFVISGKTLEFNTETKQGRLGGRVQMKIFNLENETNPEPEAKTRAK